jgi:thiol:disulfide interchange protein DsbD
MFRRLLALLALLAAAGTAVAQPVRTERVEAELVAATDAVVPGQPLEVALRLKHDEHWHTYWRVPGDSGLPTKIEWQLPAGWTASDIRWPVPQRLPIGPLANYGYEGEVLLLVTLAPPASLKTGDRVALKARADWLVCKDVCIPEHADLQLALPAAAGAGPSKHAARFAAARSRVPTAMALEQASATIDGGRIRLAFKPRDTIGSAEFFPLEEARLEAAAAQPLKTENGLAALYLTAAQPVAADFNNLRGVLVVDGGPARSDRGGYAAEISVALVGGAVANVSASLPGAGGPALSFWLALGLAFVGGLILNLMPCVFPVLSLKLLSLVQHRREGGAPGAPAPASAGSGGAAAAHGTARGGSLAAHGAAYAAGVVASFALLAAAMLALRAGGAQLGWGFQLQTPWVVAALTALFFLIGLNLLGVFEFTAGTGLANTKAAQRVGEDRLIGSLGTGVLAVVVAAPCTAPFMGAALGYAIAQPAAQALAVFVALGLGMAAPYVLLTVFPRLLVWLPRPGVWMQRFKQWMAFPMFATCVWLLWVLAQQVDVDALALLMAALVLLALAAWAWGVAQGGGRAYRWVGIGAALLAVYTVFAATGNEAPARVGTVPAGEAAAAWEPWSVGAQRAHLAAGRPVFVDFTAAWCVSCQANKRLVLSRDGIRKAFRDRDVVLMRADWTNRDDAITQELARFQRSGVPLYVLYDTRGTPRLLPELLTERTVLDALAAL